MPSKLLKKRNVSQKIEIPKKEKWLWKNKATLKKVKKGIQDSAAKRIKSKGSFVHFVD